MLVPDSKYFFIDELLSVFAERQRETEILQKIITSIVLELRKKDKEIEELNKTLNGNKIVGLLFLLIICSPFWYFTLQYY